MLSFDDVGASREKDDMRKPRFKRVPPKTGLQMRESMYEVLELIYQFKALRSHHVAMHLPNRHERGLAHSLRRLFDHGLLDKIDDLRKFNALYQHDTYTLTKKGRQSLSGRDLPPRFLFLEGGLEIKLSREWDHSMMTIDLLSNLVAGARQQGIQVVSAEEIYSQAQIEHAFVFPRKSQYTDRRTREVRPYTVVPDGVFGLSYPNGKTAYFAIEAEHNKPHERFDDDDPASTQSSTKKKFKHYRDINWKAVYDGLGIGNMRVLVVAPTPTQIENKFKVGRKVVNESHLFLGHWLPTVSGQDVPTIPQIIDAPWLRIGLPPEQINAPSLRAG
ncbi:replication-relaxation family protein [uncultured Roseobacter sp.]|uniref:replication-relaxation family protein n=1 Tax=uncultured Roseobacter sp. TaxID=114847 RepID=UPI002614A3C3|nr:replication-relaxation family protein [uncultured Roseobacter sp.]